MLEEFPLDDVSIAIVGFMAVVYIFALLIGLFAYSMEGLALHRMGKVCGAPYPWLAWIPVANVWILGSLSDQFRYVVRGQVRSKRKVLLTLNIISAVMGVVMVVALVAAVIRFVLSVRNPSETELVNALLGSIMGILALCVPLAGVAIAAAVLRFMALYDIYTSCDPANNTVYLVLSILFSFTQAIFLFLCRNRDDGMPPRRDAQPQYRQPAQEPWEQQDTNGTNYL